MECLLSQVLQPTCTALCIFGMLNRKCRPSAKCRPGECFLPFLSATGVYACHCKWERCRKQTSRSGALIRLKIGSSLNLQNSFAGTAAFSEWCVGMRWLAYSEMLRVMFTRILTVSFRVGERHREYIYKYTRACFVAAYRSAVFASTCPDIPPDKSPSNTGTKQKDAFLV